MSRIAITCGDPAGIGPELIAAWSRSHFGDVGDIAVIGPPVWLDSLGPSVTKVAVGPEDFSATPGKPDGEGALTAWAALERAAQGCLAGEYSGVVTGPVSKDRLARIGWGFAGQTEFFASRWGGTPTMAFCGGKMSVVLLSWHIPLRSVPDQLTPENFSRTVAAADELARSQGVQAPRIGVCGLNPHAGENGLLGDEEHSLINPILSGLRGRYPGLSSCEPADTLFARHLRGEFDVIIALYHDQGLAPLKAVDFDEAVNTTLGLPFVRTSPDHGTAFGIAGQGIASPRSLGNAVEVARRLIRRGAVR